MIIHSRGGVIEDVLGLEDTFWSRWPWPQVLENCPVLGSRTTLFLNRWNFVGKRQKSCEKSAKTFFLVSSSRDCLKKNFWRPFSPEKNFWRPFFLRSPEKKNLKTCFLENTCVCVLGLERVCPWPRNFFVSLALDSSLVSSNPPPIHRLPWILGTDFKMF